MRGAAWLVLVAAAVASLLLATGTSGALIRNQQDVSTLQKLLQAVLKYEEDIQARNHVSSGAEAEAKAWLVTYNEEYRQYQHTNALAEFVYTTNLTQHNQAKYSDAENALNLWQVEQIAVANSYRQRIPADSYTDSDVARMLTLICNKNSASASDEVNRHISDLRNAITEIYDIARPDGKTLDELSSVLHRSRDWDELAHAWQAWHDATGPRMRDTYTQLIQSENEVMKQNGWSDTGQYWRVVGFESDDIEAMVDSLFAEIMPLYKQLHAYVRRKLIETYDGHDIDPRGPIPAHLLGNMWAQEWGGIIDLAKPYTHCQDVDVTPQLKAQNYSVHDMFKMAEEFFTSLGLDPMTDAFWEHTMFTRPADREVQCHASATDIYSDDDYRIKMCTYRTSEDLKTIHHEMGHIEYFMEISDQPTIYREGANTAFHEAIGDTIALSVATPGHYATVGLLNTSADNAACHDTVPSDADINFLLQMALNKVGFLPYGYLLDKYRWEVFRGTINDSNYNAEYWRMRKEYQGLIAPVERDETSFDPGAKFHIASHVPYIRYFLSHLGQFQFHKAMCDAKGHQGALHTCDVYRSTEAGDLLKSMLSKGLSQPWQDTMEEMTGQRHFSTQPLYEYFDPLLQWLKVQNKDEHIGWE